MSGFESLPRPPVIVEPMQGQKQAEYCVIWLHGLGANGHDFESIVPELQLDLAIKYVFPHAPEMPVTINMGMQMPAWYDIRNMASLAEDADWAGMKQSEAYLSQLIELAEAEGFKSDNILLAGFSQGGVIAYRTALQLSKNIAGLMVLSSYLPLKGDEEIQIQPATPVMVAHGTMDPVVPYQAGLLALQALKQAGLSPAFYDYPMQHQVCMEEIQAMSEFIRSAFMEE